jgi:hypothetical protein
VLIVVTAVPAGATALPYELVFVHCASTSEVLPKIPITNNTGTRKEDSFPNDLEKM